MADTAKVSAKNNKTSNNAGEVEDTNNYENEKSYGDEDGAKKLPKRKTSIKSGKKILKKRNISKPNRDTKGLNTFKPYFWDEGNVEKERTMRHLPEDSELISFKIEYLQSMLWDDFRTYYKSFINNKSSASKKNQTIAPENKIEQSADNLQSLNHLLPTQGSVTPGSPPEEKHFLGEKRPSRPQDQAAVRSQDERDLTKAYILEHGIYNIFQTLMVDLLTRRPADPLTHMIRLMHDTNQQQLLAQDVMQRTCCGGTQPPDKRDAMLRGLHDVISKEVCDPQLFQPKIYIQHAADQFKSEEVQYSGEVPTEPTEPTEPTDPTEPTEKSSEPTTSASKSRRRTNFRKTSRKISSTRRLSSQKRISSPQSINQNVDDTGSETNEPFKLKP